MQSVANLPAVDLLSRILHHTFLNPFFVGLFPLAYRAQTFEYHHPPLYLSIAWTAITAVYWLAGKLNERLTNASPPRTVDYTDEVLVITGGSSGLGLLIAEVYGMRGVSVAVLDVVEPEGGEARNIAYYRCDVGDLAAVQRAAAQIEADLGTPTILINNAAIVHGKPLLELTPDEVERSFRTNVLAHFYTVKTFLPGMLANPTGGGGTIVTVSSVLGQLPPARAADYAATKAAARALHFSLTAELAAMEGDAARRIKTLLVTPGQLSTPMFAGVDTPNSFFAPVLEPVDVTKDVIAAIDGGQSGEIALPLYVRWIDVFWCLPTSLRRLARWASGVDTAMSGFVGRKGLRENDEKEII